MTNKPIDVTFEGTQIILPVINGKQLGYREAIEALQRKSDEENEVVEIYHEIQCSPLDGAVAFSRALIETFGWTETATVKQMFGESRTTMVGVPTGPETEEQIPYGPMKVPGIEGVLQTAMKPLPPTFIVGGKIKRKNEPQIKAVLELANKIVKERSIYKGKAVKVNFAWEREGRDFDPFTHAPKFMALDRSLETNLIFSDEVMRQLEIGLFTPIEHKEACRRYHIPLKRGVLLYGQYGTGKTLTATITALKALRNDWTFVYLDDVRDLKRGLEFAARYAPSILFAEDVDRVVTGERSSGMDGILNTLDGVDTKKGEIITVFTTNHIENINPALLRMGRLDVLVKVNPPDAKAAEKLVSLYARGLLADNVNLSLVSEKLAGKIPAFIREVTERAKIAAISRLGGARIEGNVTEVDLMDSITQMENHEAFLKPKEKKVTPPNQLFMSIPTDNPASRQILDTYAGIERNGGHKVQYVNVARS